MRSVRPGRGHNKTARKVRELFRSPHIASPQLTDQALEAAPPDQPIALVQRTPVQLHLPVKREPCLPLQHLGAVELRGTSRELPFACLWLVLRSNRQSPSSCQDPHTSDGSRMRRVCREQSSLLFMHHARAHTTLPRT